MKYLILFLISFNVFSANLYKLDIYKADASTYWTETFDSNEKLTKWLDDEKTRNYWKAGYTTSTTVINNDPVVIVATPLQQMENDMSFGKNLYAKIRLISIGKGLNKGQRKAMRTTLSSIRDDLFDGDICSARDGIQLITPDASVSAQNIIDVTALIDAYKACP